MHGNELGLMHFWQAGDAVTHGVAYLLLAMSVVSWYLILSKTWVAFRQRRSGRVSLDRFWNAHSIDQAMTALRQSDTPNACCCRWPKRRWPLHRRAPTARLPRRSIARR